MLALFLALAQYLKDYASISEARTLTTLVLLKEWDDRTGASRLWLLRRNPAWIAPHKATTPMEVNLENPSADDAESLYHANIILNFMEDVSLAITHQLINVDTITEDLLPTFRLWWKRTQPVRDLVAKDERGPGWTRAESLFKNQQRL